MENFFYNDSFYSDLGDLIAYLDIEPKLLEDDWIIECEKTTLEKIFVMDKKWITDIIVSNTDIWEDRFPEDSDDLFKRIEKAINDSINIDKLNENLPSLYYMNGIKFQITKEDIIEYCK